MTISFIGKILQKKQQRKTRLKIAIIALLVSMLLWCILHIANVFILKYAVINVLSDLSQNNIKSKYQLSSNIFTGKIKINNLKFNMQSGSTGCDQVVVKQTAGILTPSEINIKIINLWTTAMQNNKIYQIKQEGNEKGFFVKINGGIIKKPSFAGIRISSPAIFTMTDQDNQMGQIRIDKFATLLDGDKKETQYKGSMIFYDKAFIPYVFLLDTPFKWDINLKEFKEQNYIGLNKTNKVEITNVKIEKFFMDFDFSKMSVVGTLNYAQKLNNIDIEVNIENDDKFIDNMFNLAITSNGDGTQQIKKFRNAIQKIIPDLKKNNQKSNEKNLRLFIKKTDIMPDYIINDISFTELAIKVGNLMK